MQRDEFIVCDKRKCFEVYDEFTGSKNSFRPTNGKRKCIDFSYYLESCRKIQRTDPNEKECEKEKNKMGKNKKTAN